MVPSIPLIPTSPPAFPSSPPHPSSLPTAPCLPDHSMPPWPHHATPRHTPLAHPFRAVLVSIITLAPLLLGIRAAYSAARDVLRGPKASPASGLARSAPIKPDWRPNEAAPDTSPEVG